MQQERSCLLPVTTLFSRSPFNQASAVRLLTSAANGSMASLNLSPPNQLGDSSASGSERSSEASTSYKSKLPDKKTFIATLSGGAFIVGLTGATIYGLRKAKLQALKEAQELAEASIASTQSGSLANSTASAVAAKPAVPAALRARSTAGRPAAEEDEGESTSALALFRQMNSAILSPSKRSNVGSNTESPTGKQPSTRHTPNSATWTCG